MTITDAQAGADAARRDAHTVTALVDHTNLVDQELVAALSQVDQFRDGLSLLLQHYQHPTSMHMPSRANALRRGDGSMDDAKVVAYLVAVLGGEAPRAVLDRLNTERTHDEVLAPSRQVAQSLHMMADKRVERGHRQAGQATVQPALPPGPPSEHTPESDVPPETAAEQTGAMVLRIVEAEGAENPAQVVEMIAHGTGTPQQAGDAVRAVFGVPTDPTQVLPIVPAYDAMTIGDGAQEPRPFGRAVVQAGASRPHGASAGAAVNGSHAHE